MALTPDGWGRVRSPRREGCQPGPSSGLALAVLVLALASPAHAQYGTQEDPFQILVFLPEPSSASDKGEMVRAANTWADYLSTSGVGQFQARHFDTFAEVDAYMAESRDSGRPPLFGVLSELVALSKAREWGAEPIFCPIYEGRSTIRRLIIAPRNSPATSIEDFRGMRLATVQMWAELPQLLGVLLFEEATDPYQFFESLVPLENQSDCLVAVMRRQADAGLVTEGFFDAAQHRNRQVWREFKVVVELAELHLAPMMVFENTPPEMVEAIKVLALTAQDSEAGRDVPSTSTTSMGSSSVTPRPWRASRGGF